MMMTLVVAAGAGMGACLRYALTLIGKRLFPSWPAATLVINTLGAWLVGVLASLMLGELAGGFFVTGLCGGFTTFSTFMVDGIILLHNRRYGAWLSYFAGTVGLGLIAVSFGLWCGQAW